MFNFQCCKCGVSHKGTAKNFPMARMGMVQVVDDPGGKIISVDEHGNPTLSPKTYTHKQVITGYVCRWCLRKQYIKEKLNATQQLGNQSIREKISSEEQRGGDNGNTRTDVRESSKNNIWSRTRGFFSGVRGKVLQNHDKSGVFTK